MSNKKKKSAAAVGIIMIGILMALFFMTKDKPVHLGKPAVENQGGENKKEITRSAKLLRRISRYGLQYALAAVPQSPPVNYADTDTFTFADLNGVEFWFGSGAGAWSTIVTIQSDGTFEGYYHDSDTGGSYMAPRGVRYECRFHGQFTALKKTGPYEYSMKCSRLELQEPVGIEREEDGIVIVTTTAYGFDNADEFALYLPGKKISELPKQYRGGGSMGEEVMERYGMYNIGGDQSYEVWPEFDESLLTSGPVPTPTPISTLSPAQIARKRSEYGFTDSDDFQFSELKGMIFWSYRGGGESTVEIEADGTFHGTFINGSYLPPEEGYPNGVYYECRYSGRFSAAVKTGPYEYTMQCESLQVEGNVGDETIIDGVKVITSEPHGFDLAGEFKLYAPGKRRLELPKEFFEWHQENPEDGITDGYILYNVGGNEFFGVPKG